VITGGAGADTIDGGEGDDDFVYLLQADLFTGSTTVDTKLTGGAGTADELLIGTNTVTFTIAGTDAWDGVTTVEKITAVANNAVVSITLDVSAYTAGIREVDLTNASAAAQVINVSEFTGTDAITIKAGAGGSTLTGGAGGDIITGGAAVDTITGGLGADTITGAGGQDVITLTETTAAADTVVVGAATLTAGNATADTITGFAVGAGADKLDVAFSANNGTSAAVTDYSAITPTVVADNGTADANSVLFVLSGANDQMATSTLANAVVNAVAAMTSGADFAAANIVTGDDVIVILDDGADSFVFAYTADGTPGTTAAADLELLAIVKGVTDAGSFAAGDVI